MKLLDAEALKEKGISYSRTHLWRLVKKGQFPAPIKLGIGRVAWLESEIDEWILEKIRERDTHERRR